MTFVDWDRVSHAIARVEHKTCDAARGVECKHRLRDATHGRHRECLKHDLSHLFTVSLRAQGRLCDENGRLDGINAQLVVEHVSPDLCHALLRVAYVRHMARSQSAAYPVGDAPRRMGACLVKMLPRYSASSPT